MNVLWITNIMLPPICEKMNMPTPVVGGWLYSSLSGLWKFENVNLAVATVYSGKDFQDVTIDSVRYFLLPLGGRDMKRYNKVFEGYWRHVKSAFNPDVVHIHGTEYPHGLAYVKACGSEGAVASIQGLVSVYSRYYLAGFTEKEIHRNESFKELIRHDNIIQQQKKFYRRGEYEKELLRSIHYVIGRTSWDKAQVWAINSHAKYYHCNETLRDDFYNHVWKFEECEKHTIFTSQATYPIKGLHILLKAMPLVIRQFPDSMLYVAGPDITSAKWNKITGYARIIRKMINEYDLEGHMVFTGPLDEHSMCERYLKSNVFVIPSSIENSSNSLCEAQMLGMPYLSSFVGGSPDMAGSDLEALYRFEDYETLAAKICNIFERESFNIDTSRFMARHDREKQSTTLLAIYSDILKYSGK